MKNNYNFIKQTILILLIILITTFIVSCNKEITTNKQSSHFSYSTENIENIESNSFYLTNNSLCFFTVKSKYVAYNSQGHSSTKVESFNRIEINKQTGIITKKIIPNEFNPNPLISEYNIIGQLIPNSNYFLFVKWLMTEDTINKTSIQKYKIYVTNSDLTPLGEIFLFDSLADIGSIYSTSDGRILMNCTLENKKKLVLYSSDFKVDWVRSIDDGNANDNFENVNVYPFGDFIYVVQNTSSNLVTQEFRIKKFSLTGSEVSTYREKRGKSLARQMIINENDYYVIGTKYISTKSTYDLHVTKVGKLNNLIEEHDLNILDYLPDWNVAVNTLNNTSSTSKMSSIIKTNSGYYFALAYPNDKNGNNLALIKLNEKLETLSAKIIAKNIGSIFFTNSTVLLKVDNENMNLIWLTNNDNFIYKLDLEGNLVTN